MVRTGSAPLDAVSIGRADTSRTVRDVFEAVIEHVPRRAVRP
jgi:hypothetical protein